MRIFFLAVFLCAVAFGSASLMSGEVQADLPWQKQDCYAKLMMPGQEKPVFVTHDMRMADPAGDVVWRDGSVKPGTPGISMISSRPAQHDFVRALNKGDVFKLALKHGQNVHYKVTEFIVQPQSELAVPHAEDESILLLTSCYKAKNWQQDKDICFVVKTKALPEGLKRAS